jgi:sterol desaturase/sphingolipid hydroxylase (fatty acid hydroxylase superfamily)
MDFLDIAITTGLSLVVLVLIFLPMERVFPARSQKFFRPGWFLDLCFFVGQYALWTTLVILALSYVNHWLKDIIPQDFRTGVAAQPWWLQFIEVIVLSDFLIYWGHRLQHNNNFLWRFHKVHHSVEHMDWLAAHREHPLDTIYTVGLINLPAFILGFPLETIAGFIAFRGIWAIYIHSNVRLPIGPLRMLIGAPELHHWHHDKARDAGNYANISPLMDIIFGTYTCPDHEPKEFGIHEEVPKNYVGQMLEPLGINLKFKIQNLKNFVGLKPGIKTPIEEND